MFFYIILIIIVFFVTQSYKGKEASNNAGYFIVSFILTLIAAIRYDVGSDYSSYYTMLNESILIGFERFEPLSLLICIVSIITGKPELFFIISSIIIYPLVFYAFKKYSVHPSLSLIIYVGLFYPISLSIVRQAIAVSICLFGYKYIIEKSFIKYTLCIIIAVLFHYSAFVALSIYPLLNWIKLKNVILILAILLPVSNILFSILHNLGLYSNYLDNLSDFTGGKLNMFIRIMIFVSFFLIIKYKGYTDYEKRMLSVLLVGLVIPFILGPSMGERLGYYFFMYFCYAIPILLRNKRINKTLIYSLFFVLFFLATIYYTSNIQGQASAYTPYRTIFNTSNLDFR